MIDFRFVNAQSGNMDTPEMRAGVTCYVGVNVEGALFSIGDGHCRQGGASGAGSRTRPRRTRS